MRKAGELGLLGIAVPEAYGGLGMGFVATMLGCDYIIATSAVGSLKEEIKPGDLVFLDQFIDQTKSRKLSFYEGSGEVG